MTVMICSLVLVGVEGLSQSYGKHGKKRERIPGSCDRVRGLD